MVVQVPLPAFAELFEDTPDFSRVVIPGYAAVGEEPAPPPYTVTTTSWKPGDPVLVVNMGGLIPTFEEMDEPLSCGVENPEYCDSCQ